MTDMNSNMKAYSYLAKKVNGDWFLMELLAVQRGTSVGIYRMYPGSIDMYLAMEESKETRKILRDFSKQLDKQFSLPFEISDLRIAPSPKVVRSSIIESPRTTLTVGYELAPTVVQPLNQLMTVAVLNQWKIIS